MQITIEINGEKLVDEIFQNFPEAAPPGVCPACVGWDYENFEFEFEDFEDCDEDDNPKRHTVNKEMALKGLRMFIEAKARGELKGVTVYDFRDAGEYDAEAACCIVQYAIYGEVIYG